MQPLHKKKYNSSSLYLKSTNYGLHSLSYRAAKLWNLLPNSMRTSNFADFKKTLASLDMQA